MVFGRGMQGWYKNEISLLILMVTPITVTITLWSDTVFNYSTEIITLRRRFESSKLRRDPSSRRCFARDGKNSGYQAVNFD